MDRIILFTGFIVSLLLASSYAFTLIRPTESERNDLLDLIADIKTLELHLGSSIVKSYRLSDVTILNGTIILGREQLWQFIYPQNSNIIYLPVYVSHELYLNGLVTLNLTSSHLNGSIVVEVRRV